MIIKSDINLSTINLERDAKINLENKLNVNILWGYQWIHYLMDNWNKKDAHACFWGTDFE